MKNKDNFSLGMPTLVELSDIEETIELCQKLGLDFIELNMNMLDYCPENLSSADIKKISRETGIDFTLHLPEEIDLASFHSSIREGHIQRCKEAIKWSAQAGIDLVNLHINNGIYFTLPDKKVWIYDQYEEKFLAQLFESFSELVDLAGNLGVKICVENAANFYLPFVKKAVNELCLFDEVGLTWDVGHDAKADYHEREILLANENKIKHMHLHDFKAGSDHQVLFTGELDIEDMISFAEERKLKVVVETKTVDALKESVVKLRER